jgi:hypothetical protein
VSDSGPVLKVHVVAGKSRTASSQDCDARRPSIGVYISVDAYTTVRRPCCVSDLEKSRSKRWMAIRSGYGRSSVLYVWISLIFTVSFDIRKCMFVFWLPPPCRLDLRSSGILRGIVQTFRDNLSVPSSRVKKSKCYRPSSWTPPPLKVGPIGCPQT